MNFVHTLAFDAPLEQVVALYRHEAFPAAKYQRVGHHGITAVARHEHGDQLETRFQFKMAVNPDVPAIAKPFITGNERLLTTQIEQWDFQTLRGRVEVVIEAFKALTTIRCTMQLTPRGNGCVNTMQWQVDCRVALVGGRIATYIGEDVQQKIAAEGDATAWLLQGGG